MSNFRGFTIAETLTVLGILAVLSAITFTLTAPARESGRQSVCASNLKQIYAALALYSADEEGPDQLPGLHLKLPGTTMVVAPYLRSKDVLFCPDAPAKAKERLATTYQMVTFEYLKEPIASNPSSFVADFNAHGPSAVLGYCGIHDLLYYQPRERVDPDVARPFLLELLVDGSVQARRSDRRRDNLMEKYLK
jgi:type II secretory pathway pseudopilin PulG